MFTFCRTFCLKSSTIMECNKRTLDYRKRCSSVQCTIALVVRPHQINLNMFHGLSGHFFAEYQKINQLVAQVRAQNCHVIYLVMFWYSSTECFANYKVTMVVVL